MIIRAFEQFIKLIEQNLEAMSEQNGWVKIETIGRSFLELYQEYPDYFKAIANYETQKEDFSSDDQLMQEYYQKGEQAFEFLTTAVKEGIADGSIREDIDVTDTALILWANIMGVNSLVAKKKAYLEGYHQREVEEIITAMFDFAKRSIRK
ncbi:hypothetical protein [Halanaerobacter jeridensis]|uniref:hypothetical protein n=1 Tax=Halanaerobacter jeridensis TaxID=706427 RepID=UPI00195B1E2B|nr:hypothetical protein [Halanaerobacter jeridensis]